MSGLENKQTMVLEQADGKKIYLELNVSTDTTAIWSFWLAMVVALILGASATLIAIWYGRKSFKLTEMSFKTVIEEIKIAQQSAIDLNKKLFEQQITLRDLEQKQITLDRLREDGSTFIINTETFLYYVVSLYSHLLSHKTSNQQILDKHAIELAKKIEAYFDLIIQNRSKLVFSALEVNVFNHDQIDEVTSIVIRLVNRLKNQFASNTFNLENFNLELDITGVRKEIQKLKGILITVLSNN